MDQLNNQNNDINKLIFIEACKDLNLTHNNTQETINNQNNRRRRRTGVFLSNENKDKIVENEIIKDFNRFSF
jgi:hypothetical protein